ncbi:MAG: sulfoxide reductase heme-binding subunit YedZ [Syntrophus sp. (in: bacteria)]|nr:sulfoxide reductase heme-binding subunit YedZ [Syntrophus sp. (in: bacteria)]
MRFADRLKIVFCIICLMPVSWLVFLAFTLGLGANPIEKVIHTTGDWALNFLLLTLTITPLCSLTGWSWPAKLRKISGIFSFLYAGLHFITYVVLDQGLSWSAISDDVIKHKRIAVGFGSLLLLVPPAVTSTSSMKRLLGYDRWKNLQSTVYAAAVGGAVHYLWLVKKDTRRPLAYVVVLFILFGYRALAYLLKQRKKRRVTLSDGNS